MKLGYGFIIAAGLMLGPTTFAQEKTTPPAKASKSGSGAQQAQENQGDCRSMMGGMKGMGGSGMGGMGCGHMRSVADVKVEQTKDGAVLRLTAKSPEQVAQVQQHAQMMKRCMTGSTEAHPESGQKKK